MWDWYPEEGWGDKAGTLRKVEESWTQQRWLWTSRELIILIIFAIARMFALLSVLPEIFWILLWVKINVILYGS